MAAIADIPAATVQATDRIVHPTARHLQSPQKNERVPRAADRPSGGAELETSLVKPSPDSESVNSLANTSSGTPCAKTSSDQTPSTHDNNSEAIVAGEDNVNRGFSTSSSPTVEPTGKVIQQVDNTNGKISSEGPQCKTFSESNILCSANSPPTDVDRFDTSNNGDVVKYFFTSTTRNRPLSPVQEHDCISIQFHDDSDLYIKTKNANGSLYVFEVHSGMLAASSPVFNRMVYSTHKRGNKEAWVWELKDDPMGLRAMFSILHHNVQAAMFMHNPRPDQLLNVLTVLDKYGVSDKVFHPSAKAWMEAFRKASDATALKEYELLYIAYKLGDFKSFKKYIRQVAHQVEVLHGVMRLQNGKALQDVVPISDQVLEAIKAVRINDAECLLSVLKEAYNFLIDGTKVNEPRFCKSVDHHIDCHQKLLGSLLSNLAPKQLYPFPNLNQGFEGTVSNLANKMGEMEIRGLYLPGLEPHKQRHGQCRLDLESTIERVTEGSTELQLPDALLEQMYLTVKRVGIFKEEKAEFKAYKAQMASMLILYRAEFSHHIRGWADHEGETDVESLFSEDEETNPLDDSVWVERKVSQ